MIVLTSVSLWNYNTNFSTTSHFLAHDDNTGYHSGSDEVAEAAAAHRSSTGHTTTPTTSSGIVGGSRKSSSSTKTTTPYSYTFHGRNYTYPLNYFVEQYPNPTYTGNDWIFQTNKYCNYTYDQDGICNELTYLPSPRTKYSVQEDYFHYKQWWKKHYKLRNDYVNFYQNYINNIKNKQRQQRQQQQQKPSRRRRPIIFLGDSIFETYMGTWFDLPLPQLMKYPNIFQNTLAKAAGTFEYNDYDEEKKYYFDNNPNEYLNIDPTNPLVVAICGDLTQQLFYNMIHTLFFSSISSMIRRTTTTELLLDSYNNNKKNSQVRRRLLEQEVDSNNNSNNINDTYVPTPTHIPDLTTLMKDDPDNMSPIFVVLIGTNNVAQGALPIQAAHGIYSIVRFLLNQINEARGNIENGGASTPTTAPLPYIVVVEMLPHGYDNNHAHTHMPYVDQTNTLLRHDVIPSLQNEYGQDRLGLVACGKEFIKYNYTLATATSSNHARNTDPDPSNKNYHEGYYEKLLIDKETNQTIQRAKYETDEMLINKSLFMDLIHPNVRGHRILLQCIFDHLFLKQQQQQQEQNRFNT